MQSHRIIFYGVEFLLPIWMVLDGGNGGLNGVHGKDLPEKYEVPYTFTNDKNVSCDVKGEIIEGENPDQCWAFKGDEIIGQIYKDAGNGSCCYIVDEDKDVPDYLKGIVEVNDTEM